MNKFLDVGLAAGYSKDENGISALIILRKLPNGKTETVREVTGDYADLLYKVMTDPCVRITKVKDINGSKLFSAFKK